MITKTTPTLYVENIPAELKQLRQWVDWKYILRDGKPCKCPFQVSGIEAKSNEPATWTTFQEALETFERGGYEGIGFMFSDTDPYCGIDLDGCRNPETESTLDWAALWLSTLGSYCEISPSGTGWKVFCRGTNPLPNGKNKKLPGEPIRGKKPGVEIYDHVRWFAVTGDVGDFPQIVECQDSIDDFCATYWPAPTPQPVPPAQSNQGACDVVERARRYVAKMPPAISGSGGHNTTFRTACVLVLGFGLTPDEALPVFAEWNTACKPPWSDKEMRHKLADADKDPGPRNYLRDANESDWAGVPVPEYKQAAPGKSKKKSSGDKPETQESDSGKPRRPLFHLTDYGNSERLVDKHGDRIRYCHPWKKWIVYDDTRWRRDDCGAAPALAKTTVRSIFKRLDKVANKQQRDELYKWATTSESCAKITAMLTMAESEPGVPVLPAELDVDPWLFNCPNGTLDLRTFQLRPHDRADRITKLCPTAYDPNAPSFIWDRFLESVFGDQQIIDFLQRLFGYCLTGVTTEQVLPIFWGVGSNGKSTLVKAILRAMGKEYAITVDRDLLVAKDQHPTGLTDLHGTRFAVASETEDGHQLNESLVKQLTGSDNIRARKMQQDFWEFESTHKVILSTNHKPNVRGTDHAIWRRLALVQFDQIFWDADKGESGPDHLEMDKTLPARLDNEAPGILAWCVRGCQQWQAQGLAMPASVRAATNEYRSDQDVIKRFIDEFCIVSPQVSVKAGKLYDGYKRWCEQEGEKALTNTKFGRTLTEKRFESRTSNGTVREGITLKSTHDGD